ncbi:MAG: response regulator [Proteobacteria bacterium]|nr:response regulator [Pseudomonadota bacterium]MBU1640461.1 response regulator [Pseudomonadota bacterium]
MTEEFLHTPQGRKFRLNRQADQLSYTLLIVDDEPQIISAVRRLLLDEHITIASATSAGEALDFLAHHEVAVLLTDNCMPEMSGLELLNAAKKTSPDTVRLMMTGNADLQVALSAINEGEVYKFIVKPWHNQELIAMIMAAVNRFQLMRALQSTDELTLRSLGQTIELKDVYTRGHCDRVAHFALLLADALGFSEKRKKHIRHGCWLHDCGKIGIPGAILNKEGKLTADEFELIKKHPLWGLKVAEEAGLDQAVLDIIVGHHERFDGKGYPHGLVGEAIPLEARIAAIADVYDALTTDRAYRTKFSHTKAVKIMTSERGKAFETALLDLFWTKLAEEEGAV